MKTFNLPSYSGLNRHDRRIRDHCRRTRRTRRTGLRRYCFIMFFASKVLLLFRGPSGRYGAGLVVHLELFREPGSLDTLVEEDSLAHPGTRRY